MPATHISRSEIDIVIALDKEHAVKSALAAKDRNLTEASDERLGLPEFGCPARLREVTCKAENDGTTWLVLSKVLCQFFNRGWISITSGPVPTRRPRRIKSMLFPEMKIRKVNNYNLSCRMRGVNGGGHK